MAAQGWLAQSRDDHPTRFHLEAAIALQHCIAPDVGSTDWNTIIRLYTRLLQLGESPLYVLNRAIAMGQAGNADEAMTELQGLREREEMENYLLLDCALGRIHELQGSASEAIDCYLAALSKATAPHEKELLERKIRKLAG